MPIIRAVSRGERPPRLDSPPISDDAWKLMHQCWAPDKRYRPGIRDVVKIMKSWKRPPSLTSTPTFPQSPSSAGSTSALNHKVSGRSNRSDSSGKQSNGGAPLNGASSAKRSASAQARKRSSGLSYMSAESIPETPPPLPFHVPPVMPKSSRAEDEGKISIAIDFGKSQFYDVKMHVA